jgi:hypothetical protein
MRLLQQSTNKTKFNLTCNVSPYSKLKVPIQSVQQIPPASRDRHKLLQIQNGLNHTTQRFPVQSVPVTKQKAQNLLSIV